jgi:hypothetical protein
MSELHFMCVCVCVCVCKQLNETKFAKMKGVIEEADLIKVHYMQGNITTKPLCTVNLCQ